MCQDCVCMWYEAGAMFECISVFYITLFYEDLTEMVHFLFSILVLYFTSNYISNHLQQSGINWNVLLGALKF